MSGFSNIRVEIDAPKGVAVVRFDRPAKRNAFSQAMIGEIVSALAQVDASDDVRAVVLTGGPEGPFCGESKSTSAPPATARRQTEQQSTPALPQPSLPFTPLPSLRASLQEQAQRNASLRLLETATFTVSAF
jgi:enoyl-CoA hydratase/isomerase-like protein